VNATFRPRPGANPRGRRRSSGSQSSDGYLRRREANPAEVHGDQHVDYTFHRQYRKTSIYCDLEVVSPCAP